MFEILEHLLLVSQEHCSRLVHSTDFVRGLTSPCSFLSWHNETLSRLKIKDREKLPCSHICIRLIIDDNDSVAKQNL